MSDDVTIPRDQAQQLADFLMRHGLGRHHHLVKLLDPPQPSLRDEVASVLLDNGWTCEYHEPDAYCGECRRLYAVTADAVLAVVRKRIEALPKDHGGRDTWWVNYHDVLALLGGEGT